MRFCDMVAGAHDLQLYGGCLYPQPRCRYGARSGRRRESVEFGRLGSLSPTLRSKAVAQGEEFNAMTHITRARVRLRPNPKFFRLDDVAFERIALEKKAKGKKGKGAQPKEGGHPAEGTPGAGDTGAGGHVGI